MEKRLNEMKGFENVSFLVKFLKDIYLDTILNGDIYMNNFKFFIDLEASQKNKGQGDQFEAAHVFKFNGGQLVDIDTGNVIGNAKFANLVERYEIVDEIPLYCYTQFHSKDCIVYQEDEHTFAFKLDIPYEEQVLFQENFGNKAVLLPGDFFQIVKASAEKQNLQVYGSPVKYVDYNVFYKNRYKEFEEGSVNLLFWKDNFFRTQRELRFVILNHPVKESMILHVDELIGILFPCDTEYFFNGLAFRVDKTIIL